MSEQPDHNALLLQVMAHDLLAPLTAIKWQTELLGRSDLSAGKEREYLKNIDDSTRLGIGLTKHAHVAGRVLVGSYQQNTARAFLPEVINVTLEEMHLQYERHGLTLDINIEDEARERDLDVELIGLFVWSVTKFFLSCTPANTTVSVRGMSAPGPEGAEMYVLIASAAGVPEATDCVELFSAEEARGTYDQSYVFSKLIHEIAPLIGVAPTIQTQAGLLVLESSFV